MNLHQLIKDTMDLSDPIQGLLNIIATVLMWYPDMHKQAEILRALSSQIETALSEMSRVETEV